MSKQEKKRRREHGDDGEKKAGEKELGVGDEVAALRSSRSSRGTAMVVIDGVAMEMKGWAWRGRSSKEEG